MYLTTESRIGRRWAPPQPLPVGRTSVSAPLHVVLAAGVRRAYWRAEDYFGDFFYALAAAFETWALSSQCSLSSRKDRDGGVRCRLDHAFGSAHGRRQFSDRLLWITDASCLPKSVRCQSSARSHSKVVTFPIVLLSQWTGMKTFRTRGVLRLTERLVIKSYAVVCTPRRALG